jgi:hypothetical protein
MAGHPRHVPEGGDRPVPPGAHSYDPKRSLGWPIQHEDSLLHRQRAQP